MKNQSMSVKEFLNKRPIVRSYSVAALPFISPDVMIGAYALVLGVGVGLIGLAFLEKKLAVLELGHLAESVKVVISVLLPLAAILGGIWAVLNFPISYGFY